jgi:tetratricopeptide (TPR) repeat protein
MSDLEVEYLALETELLSDADNLGRCMRMAHVCMSLRKDSEALTYLRRCMGSYGKEPTSTGEGMAIVEMGLKMWKSLRYTAKDTLRINISTDRARLLSDLHKMLELLKAREDPALEQRISFLLACVKEHAGQLQEAIALQSELIALQAMDGVDLTFIILKAAVILKHLGNHDQAIEYLEFLLDDPPLGEGYGRTHVLAFLALTYDQHPKRQDFVVVLRNTYDELLQVRGLCTYLPVLSLSPSPLYVSHARTHTNPLRPPTHRATRKTWPGGTGL